MINNSKQQTTVNTATVSESSIYLKKSELPKNVSSFKNDAGYISSAELNEWLEEHPYISESRINSIIDSKYSGEQINRLNESDIRFIKGEIVAIKERLNDVETGFITIDKEDSFVTTNTIVNINNRINILSNDISNLQSNSSQFALKTDLPKKVSELWNDAHYLTSHQSLAAYAKKSEIPNVSDFVKRDEIPSIEGMASQEWVKSQGYLTKHQSLSAYAKKSDIPNVSDFVKKEDIPSIEGLASKEWVLDQGYLTKHQSLSAYAKKSNVYDKNYIDTNFLSKNDASSTYLTQKDGDDKYLTKLNASQRYLTVEDYRGLKDATVISKEYVTKTLSDLESDLNSLRNGFYIVHYNDIVIVKDNEIINVFKDGVPKPVIEWTVEE